MKKDPVLSKNQGSIYFAIIAAILLICLSMFRYKSQVNTYIDADMRMQIEAIQKNSTRLVQNELNYLSRLTASAAQLIDQTNIETEMGILRTLEEYVHNSSIVRALFVTDDGYAYTSYAGYLGRSEEHAFSTGEEVAEIQSLVFSPPYYAEELNKVIFDVASPVTMGGKKGVLASSYHVSQFYDLFENDFIGGTAEIGIINRKGEVIVGKDMSEFGVNIFDGLGKVEFSDSSADSMRTDFAEGKGGFSSYYVNGIERYCSYAPVQLNDWYVIVMIKEVALRSNLARLEKHGLQLTVELVVIMITLLFVIITVSFREQKKVRGILQKAAMLDGLTGIYNRSTAETKITAYLNGSDKYESSVLLVIDIDNFKLYNDNWGHIFGDLVIKECADVWRMFLRKKILSDVWAEMSLPF